MKFNFDFSKTTISTNVGAFFADNLLSDKEKESLRRVLKGNKLNYGDANALLRRVIQAIILTIPNGEANEEIDPKPIEEDDFFKFGFAFRRSCLLGDYCSMARL